MQSSHQASTPRQNKVILQRLYRANEGECFSALRDVIKDLTGEELGTRQEILRKAIDLLEAALKIRRSGDVCSTSHEICSAPQNMTSEVRMPDHTSDSPLGYTNWHIPASQTPYYPSQPEGQQDQLTFDMTDPVNSAEYSEPCQQWPPHNFQF